MTYRSVFRDKLFEGQTIVVTGGGSGIGRCTAHELASLGAKVLITGRKQEKLDKVIAEIHEDGGQAFGYAFDIREEDVVKASVKQMLADHGQIHGLVNNAGGQFPSPLSMISKKGWEAVVANNLTGGFLMAREVFTQCMKKQGGSIVNMVADMWGGMPGMGHSGAARAGMLNFTETASVEWGSAGVRVNAVAPGWIASSGMDHYDPSFATEVIPKLAGASPAKRMGEEAEVSAAIVFLLSPGAAYISGTCVNIDGASSRNARVFPLLDHKKSKPFEGFHRAFKPKAVKDS
ncbi:SDR family oxidoreductase [Stenotrophobium rhamnosiphilum]|uniref:Peroxisomal trans-2-enoyl-CoA reductase n=1 Tax=Stenotrophobium rhamnosiphilum TaxID=2029166 RepID=A0A2T5MHC1_9GAMM|nr:SDR family oxidoreductase [Stenotrophobium rhamnosiphilum]PTU31982.1 2,4-dienoyl-CoA reductase [Stenotrophobium rhamnosiphilum]